MTVLPQANHDAPGLCGFERGFCADETNHAMYFLSLNTVHLIDKSSKDFASTDGDGQHVPAFEHERRTTFGVGEQGHEAGLVFGLSVNGCEGQQAGGEDFQLCGHASFDTGRTQRRTCPAEVGGRTRQVLARARQSFTRGFLDSSVGTEAQRSTAGTFWRRPNIRRMTTTATATRTVNRIFLLV